MRTVLEGLQRGRKPPGVTPRRSTELAASPDDIRSCHVSLPGRRIGLLECVPLLALQYITNTRGGGNALQSASVDRVGGHLPAAIFLHECQPLRHVVFVLERCCEVDDGVVAVGSATQGFGKIDA